ncbi:hypothetical protein HZA85_00275 [Candidatus Uhrbacteria bacterium]|nr:hypothetical protein [Candidatus Uhrbacteria bacterium]
MPLQLKVRWDLTLNDLAGFQRAGFPVFKTPHVGNWYPNNLACAQLGIPMKVVDATKGSLDRNFHPHCIIRAGKRMQIARDDVLTSHARVTHPYVSDVVTALGDTATVDVHMDALKRAVPQAQTQTLCAYLHQHAQRVMALLEVLTREDHTIWQRYAYENGTTENRGVHTWTAVEVAGVVGTNASRAGWLSPNIANILMDVTIDPSCFGGAGDVYELSGPDMYRYIDEMMPKLSAFYDLVRRTLDWGLPEVMTLHLVPVADMRFVVPPARRSALDHLVDLWLSTQYFEASVGERMRVATDKRTLIQQVRDQRSGFHEHLRAAVAECSDPFYDISDGTFLSQYDLLDHPEGLYIHPWALETSFHDLTEAVRTLRRFLP